MANHISHASLPYPIKNARFTLLVPYLDADGDPTDPTTPDSEVSQDAGAFADAAEEVTTISGTNGMGYLTITGAETNNSAVAVAFKVASGPKATLMALYPRNLPILASGTASAGAAGTITLASSITYDITGCFIRTTGGTGGGGTGGANNQARRITAYNTSTQVATVTPNWETTPDATTTYDVLCPEGVTVGMLKALNPATAGRTLVVDASGLADANTVKIGPTGSGTSQTARDIGASVLLSSGTGTGQLDFTSGVVKANAVQLLGTAWLTPGVAGTPDVNAKLHGGTAQTGRDIGASVLLSSGTGTGQLDFTSGVVKANATQWLGGAIPAVNVTGVPLVDAKYLLGTIFATPATAGIPDVNVKNIDNDAASASGTVTFPNATLASTTNITAGTVTTATNVTNVSAGGIVAASFGANAITAAKLDPDVTTELQAGLATSTAVSTLQTSVDDLPTNAELATALGTADDAVLAQVALVKSDTAAILTDTAEIGAAGAGLTAVPWNAAWDAEVQSEATDALNAYDPPTKAELDTAVANVSVDEIQATALADLFNTDSLTTYGSAVAGSVVKEIADNAGGTGLTAGAIADAVWDEDATAHQTQGTFGQAIGDPGADTDSIWALANTNLNATVGSRASQTSVDDIPTNAELAAALASADDAVLAALAAGVTVTTNNDKTGYALTSAYDFAKGTAAMTESYAVNGAAPTPAQAMFAIHQMLMDFSIAGTSLTVKKLDNATTAFVVTLNDGTSPTAAART